MHPSEIRDEAVYDAYLTACASGSAEPPEAVFRRHPDLGDVVRARIEELWRAGRGTVVREDPAARAQLPQVLGGCRLLDEIDTGGMGTVHRAVRLADGARVAVKVLRADLARSATATERLRREALALARLRHPNVVRVHAFGQEAGTAFLVMDLVEGRGLDELVAEAAARGELLPSGRVAAWGAALAHGLAAAHAEGVVHRDVKPSNVRIRSDDSPLLLDFGIAAVPDRTSGALTTTFAGSPFYAAPEQFTGERTDGRTDVYGLCATLYQCLTGRVPFAGDRFDTVLRRVLTEEPVALRSLAPHVPLGLETVVMAGLEKDPERRPETAALLAADLEAAQRGEPVRSRRPGVARKVVRWARRRPLVAAAVVVALLGGAGAALAVGAAHRAERERILAEARAALDEAVRGTQAFAAGAPDEGALAASVRDGDERMRDSWLSDLDLARLDEEKERLRALRREREAAFHRLLAALDRAERLAPGLEGVDACRAQLHLARWRERATAGDAIAAAFYRGLVERADPDGPAAAELLQSARLVLLPDPPDAEVHLFRAVLRSDLVPRGGERLVCVPIHGGAGLVGEAPWALRVVRGAGGIANGAHLVRVAGHPVEHCVLAGAAAPPLERNDRLVSIGGVAVRDVADALRLGAPGPERVFLFARGGERISRSAPSLAALGVEAVDAADAVRRGGVCAHLWDDGSLREVALPEGLDVRVTAAPLLASAASRLGPAEAADCRLPPGDYVVLVRAAGRDDVRVPVRVEVPGMKCTIRPRLPRAGESPPGFVYACAAEHQLAVPPFWIQEREVTAGEYREFLEDAATRAAIASGPGVRFLPRHEVDPPAWRVGPDGRVRLPQGTTETHPVLGVSFEDAQQYARWRTERAASRGERWRYRLPTYREWVRAAGGEAGRDFPFGPSFRPRWASSCYARPEPAPEPVLSFPVDESAYGAYDLCGSALEWVDGWFDERRGLRRLAGGSWAQGEPFALRVYAPRGARPDRADREFGFRLVAEPAEER